MEKLNEVKHIEDKSKLVEEKIYETLHKTIEDWPDWKKQEYNDSYAVSGYTKKLTV